MVSTWSRFKTTTGEEIRGNTGEAFWRDMVSGLSILRFEDPVTLLLEVVTGLDDVVEGQASVEVDLILPSSLGFADLTL